MVVSVRSALGAGGRLPEARRVEPAARADTSAAPPAGPAAATQAILVSGPAQVAAVLAGQIGGQVGGKQHGQPQVPAWRLPAWRR